ncbi:winged helix DNA-binding domain-containing protein [Streptomyces sp. DH12]|uniref:winged helix DNA-binding domain-containing protein n=1 Tax=Streptomyces sp. DH12 TaxID=2857010 RepID=UPI001E4DF83E|nr:winged helix DNA-binding domain-containing protein [Streptomyces sp. DH12]
MAHARPRITDDQRRARLALRHHLAPSARAATVEEVAASLTALHGTDPATVHLAAGARLAPEAAPHGPVPAMERALYEDRTLVRMHGMRHTVFVVPASLAPVVQSSTTHAVAARERASFLKQVTAGSDLTADWLAEVERAALAALERLGEATATELAREEPRLRERFTYGPGTSHAQEQTVSSRLLRVLGTEGRVVRSRPLGGWTSSRFRWAVAPPLPDLPPAEARATLTRRWLATHGPATEADLTWWTGWRVTDARKALAAVAAQEVTLDDATTAYVLPADTDAGADADTDAVTDGDVRAPDATTPDAPDAPDTPATVEPWAALLPALDPTAMGWRGRDWYLDPDHRPALFDRSGNIGPTVWWNGRVVGGWAQRPDGEPVWRLLTDPGAEARAAVEAEAARLHTWLHGTRVTPRFRTPLERELSA